MTRLLAGKTALITGAAHPQGIGNAIARAYQSEGANVVITDLPGAAGLTECQGLPCNVTDRDQVHSVVADVIAGHGGLDIVVNNAGVGVGSPDFLEITAADWELSMQVNVLGVANVCQAAIPHMRERGGVIVNVASLAGLGAIDSIPACYTASKFATVGLTKQLAAQYATDNIRCNALCPGSVVTQMHAKSLAALAQQHGVSLEEAQALEDESIPMGRSAQPEEVAATAVFLASEQSRYVTGVALPVAGGMAPGL